MVCYPGQYSNGGVCVSCPPDRYQPTAGIQQQCTGVCPAGSYIPLGGNNTDISNCTCEQNSVLHNKQLNKYYTHVKNIDISLRNKRLNKYRMHVINIDIRLCDK